MAFHGAFLFLLVLLSRLVELLPKANSSYLGVLFFGDTRQGCCNSPSAQQPLCSSRLAVELRKMLSDNTAIVSPLLSEG